VEKVDEATIRRILENSKVIAVVGLSDKPERHSFQVASYLQASGYRIIPVNPSVESVLGERSYPDLDALPTSVDVVDVFRRSEAAPQLAEDAVRAGAKVLWLQRGVVSEEAAQVARAAGLDVVMDDCMMDEHKRLFGHPGGSGV